MESANLRDPELFTAHINAGTRPNLFFLDGKISGSRQINIESASGFLTACRQID